MSPKKTIKNPTPRRKITEKIPKRTVKKEKSKLNMPATIKVSIPHTPKSTVEGIHVPIIRGSRPPQFKKTSLLDFNTKVELANSVARQQLVKEEIPQLELEPENKVKKRGRKKKIKVVSDFFNVTDNCGTEDVPSPAVKKQEESAPVVKPERTRRIVTRKRLADTVTKQTSKRPKLESNTDTEPVITKIKLEVNPDAVDQFAPDSNPVVQPSSIDVQPQPTVVQPTPVVAQTTPVNVQLTPLVVIPEPTHVKLQPTVKTIKSTMKRPLSTVKKLEPAMKRPATGKKRGPKGKKEIIMTGDKSPSILDRLRKLSKKETESEGKNQQITLNIPGLVDSRKSSVSSHSNLSWTKDISSSSTTTCITVSSNDFVRFNKKLPVIKLTHIDNELKKRQNDAQETACVEEVDDNLSETSDSDCTGSEKMVSDRLNDSMDVNSLHLSASSAPSSRFSQTRSKEGSPNYEKAAEKLSLTIKKFDMEIINWFSSDMENEDVNANLTKFKDKMFDILDIEFGVITHCRRLKEILEPPRFEDMVDETCISKPVVDVDNSLENDPVEDNTNKCMENVPVKDNSNMENAPVEEIRKKVDFIKPMACRKLSNVSEGNLSSASNRVTRDDSSDDDNPAGTFDQLYYDHHDDDDALSLFAESITGFESSRMNTSIASVPIRNVRPVEEYVPKPVKIDLASNTEKRTYSPTKIREEGEITASKITTICEKQNADSTSIYKQSISTDDAESNQDFNENIDLFTRIGHAEMIKQPRLMKSLVEVLPKTRSVVFGNLCFYNLKNNCRMFEKCRFLHIKPNSPQVQDKLNLLDDRLLIQEYILMRKWPELRRRYGMCYVEECSKRGLTRILLEMAYDFIVMAHSKSDADTRLRVDTIEVALLHLNNVDLSICEDLLKMPIHSDQGNRTLLCDVFMATMSITQNFSRFKMVFLNLTYFMVDNDRTFNKDVVEHILERVGILPFEEPVARALIEMMRLTNSEIINNSMIGHFEKQISVNKDVFEEYSLLKNQYAFTSMMESSVVAPSPPRASLAGRPVGSDRRPDGSDGRPDGSDGRPDGSDGRPDGSDGQPPAPSPDTTNLDNMNKTAEEPSTPVITRTIGMNPPIIFNRTQMSHDASRAHGSPGLSRAHNSSGSSNSEDHNLNVGTWRNRSIFPHLRPPPMTIDRSMMHAPIRTPLRPLMRPHAHMRPRMPFNQRLVTFRGPNYVNRQPGPKYQK